MSGFMAEQATGTTYGFTDQGVTAALTWRFHIRGTGSNATGRAVRRRPLRRPRRPRGHAQQSGADRHHQSGRPGQHQCLGRQRCGCGAAGGNAAPVGVGHGSVSRGGLIWTAANARTL